MKKSKNTKNQFFHFWDKLPLLGSGCWRKFKVAGGIIDEKKKKKKKSFAYSFPGGTLPNSYCFWFWAFHCSDCFLILFLFTFHHSVGLILFLFTPHSDCFWFCFFPLSTQTVSILFLLFHSNCFCSVFFQNCSSDCFWFCLFLLFCYFYLKQTVSDSVSFFHCSSDCFWFCF